MLVLLPLVAVIVATIVLIGHLNFWQNLEVAVGAIGCLWVALPHRSDECIIPVPGDMKIMMNNSICNDDTVGSSWQQQ